MSRKQLTQVVSDFGIDDGSPDRCSHDRSETMVSNEWFPIADLPDQANMRRWNRLRVAVVEELCLIEGILASLYGGSRQGELQQNVYAYPISKARYRIPVVNRLIVVYVDDGLHRYLDQVLEKTTARCSSSR